jgi:cyclophilin family peptidyl-prolyl cis-trans isomerase
MGNRFQSGVYRLNALSKRNLLIFNDLADATIRVFFGLSHVYDSSMKILQCTLLSVSFALTALTTHAETSKHAVPQDAKVIDQFKGVLKPGVEYHAVVEMEKGGDFEIVFFPEVAPNHVANFVSLAKKKFYDGVTFHRVIDGFMAQGGDPTGSGRGGPGYYIPAEFSNLPHKRGTLSMARSMDPNSAGSQFFICFAERPQLDNQYTVFGEVVRGMETVDKITRRDPDSATTEGDKIKKITIKEAGSK